MIRQVGQRLREARINKRLTIEDVAHATKIRSTFLQAIEKGEYEKLPSAAYAQGFVANYAEYLGFDKHEALALFRREFDEDRIFQVLPESYTRTNEFPLQRRRIQQTVYLIIGVLLLLFGYLIFQYRTAVVSPPLEVTSPKEGAILSQDITVTGRTDPNAIIFVNNDAVSINAKGEFQKKITVFPGKTTIIIRARNRFGKESIIERKVEVKPSP